VRAVRWYAARFLAEWARAFVAAGRFLLALSARIKPST
jgi:hypothetical protein